MFMFREATPCVNELVFISTHVSRAGIGSRGDQVCTGHRQQVVPLESNCGRAGGLPPLGEWRNERRRPVRLRCRYPAHRRYCHRLIIKVVVKVLVGVVVEVIVQVVLGSPSN